MDAKQYAKRRYKERHRARSGIREAYDENKEDAVINYGPKGGGISWPREI